MADNTLLNAGTGGDTISTDDIAGVKVQRVKVQQGADGVAVDVSSAAPLQVTLANTGANATAVKVDPSAVTSPVSAASLPLPTGAATSAKQDTGNTSIASVDTKLALDQTLDLDTGAGTVATKGNYLALPANGGPVAGGTSTNPLRTDPTGSTTQPVSGTVTANLGTVGGLLTEADFDTKTGSLTEAAPASDTASSGLNGRLQRIAQRLTSLIALLPAALGANGGLKIEGVASGTAVPVSNASLPLPTGASTAANQTTEISSLASLETKVGEVQASPTANTVLDRLKALLTGIVLATGANLIGYIGLKRTFSAKATITWTGTSLANGSARESTVIDNTTNRYANVRIRMQTKGQASGTNYVDLYVYTALGDTTYTDAATGSDAAFTAANRFNSRYLGSIKCNAATAAVQAEFQMSDIFPSMPDKWGLIVINNSGAALSATAGDHVLEYEGIY